jgi:hypothetical protein
MKLEDLDTIKDILEKGREEISKDTDIEYFNRLTKSVDELLHNLSNVQQVLLVKEYMSKK